MTHTVALAPPAPSCPLPSPFRHMPPNSLPLAQENISGKIYFCINVNKVSVCVCAAATRPPTRFSALLPGFSPSLRLERALLHFSGDADIMGEPSGGVRLSKASMGANDNRAVVFYAALPMSLTVSRVLDNH